MHKIPETFSPYLLLS